MSRSAQAALGGAHWITTSDVTPPVGERPAYEFRSTFDLASPGAVATLSATAHGIYEAFLNGARVGDQELTPGSTSYGKTLYVQSYDVTDQLRPGTNELRIVVSDGWFRGRCGHERRADSYGTETAVIARLVADGHTVTRTGEDWQVAVGRIVTADLMDGQTEDLRRIGAEEWAPVVAATDPLTRDRERFAWSPAPRVRRTELYTPVSVHRLASGRQIVDFGRNLSGWTALRRLGPAGTTITLSHGEALDAQGDLTLDHLTGRLPVGQVDRVTSRGQEGDVFEPRHTTHGFRYVAVDGSDTDLSGDDIVAYMVRSDLVERGTFASSDERLDRLHEIVRQSWHGNSCDVPTDCPQRERWGFTGDFQVFSRSAAYLDDIRGFARKWLDSLADEQYDNGRISNVAPATGHRPREGAMMSADGSAGWGDAATIVPWELYRAYGDTELLRAFFPMMALWVDWAAGMASGQRSPRRRLASSEAAPHERFIWDSGWQWGEWLEPSGEPFDMGAEKSIVATAYLSHSADLTARVAAVLGDLGAEQKYRRLSEDVAAAWRIEFVRAGAALTNASQANYVRGLAFGLFAPDQVDDAVRNLVALIEDDGRHLSTGFLATGMLLPVLADHGHADLAYDILFQDTEPGWMVMLDRGATTVWESWDAVSADGRPQGSLNHYSKGAVISFLHEYIAGIRPSEPGYARTEIRPSVTRRLQWASGAVNTDFGTIRSTWTWTTDDAVRIEVEIPPGMTARVVLPDGTVHDVAEGASVLVSGSVTLAPTDRGRESQNPLLSATVGDVLANPAAAALLNETVPLIMNGLAIASEPARPFVNLLGTIQLALGAEATASIESRIATLVRAD